MGDPWRCPSVRRCDCSWAITNKRIIIKKPLFGLFYYYFKNKLKASSGKDTKCKNCKKNKKFISQVNDDGNIVDVHNYHNALFAAQNADKIANHFYEQGRADAIKSSAKTAKNINMDPRQEGSFVTTKSGDQIRVVSGDSSDKLRIKWKQ